MAVQPEPTCESRWINQRTRRAFLHLPRTLAAVPAAISGLPSDQHSGSAEPAGDDHNHAQHSQWCARVGTGPGAEFSTPSRLRFSSSRLKNQTAIGNLQAIQVSNELALAQVQQIQMLRQLVMAQMNSQNVAAANQVNAQVQSNLAAQAVFSQQYPGDSFNPTNNAPAPSQH